MRPIKMLRLYLVFFIKVEYDKKTYLHPYLSKVENENTLFSYERDYVVLLFDVFHLLFTKLNALKKS